MRFVVRCSRTGEFCRPILRAAASLGLVGLCPSEFRSCEGPYGKPSHRPGRCLPLPCPAAGGRGVGQKRSFARHSCRRNPPIHAHHLTSITASLPSLLPTLRLPDVSLPLKHTLNHPLLVSRHRNHSLFVTRGLKLSAVLLRVCAPCRSKGAIRSCAFATFQAIVSSSVYLLTTMISSDLE
jgi:hypothetical protein